MTTNIVLSTIAVAALLFIIFKRYQHNMRKQELHNRRARFTGMQDGKWKPDKAIKWLTYRLLGESSILDDNCRRYHHVTLEMLDITPEQYRKILVLYFELWWAQFNKRKPTIKEACNGTAYLNREIDELNKWMRQHAITEEELGHDSQSTRAGYMDRCCQVLEEGLYHYPDKAWQDMPAPVLQRALLDYWGNPEQELIDKWQSWVVAAKKRHAFRLLVILRRGRYKFPASDQQVAQLLVYLEKAGITPEDIETTDTELEQLRGFMRPKRRQT